MNILIADDHNLVRQGLRQILATGFPGASFGEAADGRQALDMVRSQSWDVVVLDLTMPGRSGLDALKDIKSHRSALPVLILSGHPEDQFAVRVLKAGASGYMTKECAGEELIKAVKKVSAGGKYVSGALAEKLAGELGGEVFKSPHELLSDREFEVMRRIASGRTVKEIATDLCLSIKTVSTYRARLLEKMKMKTNAELTHYAVQAGLVDKFPL